MQNRHLIFDAKDALQYGDKRVELKTSITVDSRLLIDELVWRYRHVVERKHHAYAQVVTGLDNGLVHHYRSGKSNAVTLKTILKYCDARGTWPVDIPGLPPHIVEMLTRALLELDWQPDPAKDIRFRQLFYVMDPLAARALQIRHIVEADSLQDWFKLDSTARTKKIVAAEENRQLMIQSLKAQHFELSHECHGELHKQFIHERWYPILGQSIDISVRAYTHITADQSMDANIRAMDDSHRYLICKYQSWDDPSKLEEAKKYLGLRHTKCSKLLRGISS